jgi:hypothetical protein
VKSKKIPWETIKSWQWLTGELDNAFSRFVRLSSATDSGYASCFTCGVIKPWKQLQNGHFISRGNMALRYDLRNCHPQCKECNEVKSGNLPVYRFKLIRKYGVGILFSLVRDSKKIKKYTKIELQEMIDCYKAEVKKLLLLKS